MTTRAAVQAAARKRWPSAIIIERRYAPSPSERASNIVARRALTERINAAGARIKELNGCDSALRDAARFCVDTEGDPTVLVQMRESLERVEERDRLREDREEMRKELDAIDAVTRRWGVAVDSEMFRHIKCEGDTLDQLLATIGGPA